MPTVDIIVNGRRHMVQCGEGEETRLKQLASYLDRKVTDLARGQSQIGDSRLLLMAGLTVADELSDAFDEIKSLKASLESRVGQVEQQASEMVEQVAQRLDAIAAELEKA
jgi:cell division protein ZapA